MARRVEKHDAALFIVVVGVGNFHAISANVLGNAAGLAGNDIGGANRIEQRSLAMIDVAHHRDHGRARDFDIVDIGRDQLFELFFRYHFFKGHEAHLITEPLSEFGSHFIIKSSIDSCEYAPLQ